MSLWLVVLFASCAACLSEPSRPHGAGAPVADDSRLWPATAVGDVNGDGYDDLVAWGNEGAADAGHDPTLFVYFGGESLENPDVRERLRIVDPMFPDPWDEVLAATIFINPDGHDRELIALSRQDVRVEGDGMQDGYCFLTTFTPAGRDLVATGRSNGQRFGFGGYADDPTAIVLVERDTTTPPPLRQVMFGEEVAFSYDAPADGKTDGRSFGWGHPVGEYIQGAVPIASGAHEDLLVVTDTHAYRTTGDIDSAGRIEFGPSTDDLPPHQHSPRVVRGRQIGDHVYAVVTTAFLEQSIISVLDVAGPAGPKLYLFTINSAGPPQDLAIADVDGNGHPDLVTIESQTLAVYRDLAFATDGTASSDAAIVVPELLADYDVLAVGNFHGSSELEIYVLSRTHPSHAPRCFRIDANALAPCPEE